MIEKTGWGANRGPFLFPDPAGRKPAPPLRAASFVQQALDFSLDALVGSEQFR